MEKLVIAGREFTSRLFLGTGKFDSNDLMARSIMASGTEMVTVAMKRIELEDKEDDMLKHIVRPEIQLLPNTSGVRNAEEAVFAAQSIRYKLAETRNSSRPALFVARFHGDPEGHGAVGEVGLCRIALLSGRPYALQTSGRSRSGHSHAFGSTHRDKQGIADP